MTVALLSAAIGGGLLSAVIAALVCAFSCRARVKKISVPNRKEKGELKPVLKIEQIKEPAVHAEANGSKKKLSSCPSCRKPSTFYSPCECDMIVPEKKPCQIQFSLYYNFHDSHLFINIMCALNVPLRWYGKYPPTQVRFQLLPDDSSIYSTGIKTNTAEPIFNETFEFIGYAENELMELTLRLGLYAFDKFSRGKMIGHTDVRFGLEKFHPSEPVIIWRNLRSKTQIRGRSLSLTKGEIQVSLRYEARRGRLNVIVMKAAHLMKPIKFLNTVPYVVVTLNANDAVLETRQTKKSRGTNPVWNQCFLFDVDDETINEYSITIKVMNNDLLTRDEVMGEVNIGPKCEGNGREHWESMMSKGQNRREVAVTHRLL